MTMKASLIITAKDQASSAFARVAAKTKALSAAFKPLKKEAEGADKVLGKFGRGAETRFRNIGSAAQRMGNMIAKAEKKIDHMALRALPHLERAAFKAGSGIGSLARKSAGLALGAAKWGAAGAGAGIGFGIGGIIRAGAQYEQFSAQLEGTEGSAAGAKKALDWVQKFAAETPYELDEVTDALVRARGVGIDPFNGAMRSMGDAASANRKTMLDAIEAVADAQTGEFERLKGFNITSSVKGNKVKFSFIDKDGKTAFKEVKKDAVEIQKAVLGIWDTRHSGAMIRQSHTIVGIWFNIKDKASQFMLKVWNSGFGDKLKSSLESLLNKLNQWSEDGTLDAYAQSVSEWLGKAVDYATDFVTKTDWEKVGRDAKAIGSALWDVGKAIAWAVEQQQKFLGLLREMANYTPAGALYNGYQKLFGDAPAAANAGKNPSKPSAPNPFGNYVFGGKNKAIPFPGMGAPRAMPQRGSGGPQKVGGAIDLRIRTDPGVKVQPTLLSSLNKAVPIRVSASRGPVSVG